MVNLVENHPSKPSLFYVYALIDPRQGKKRAFYIGKGTWKKGGTNERNQRHLRESIKGEHCNSKLQNKINKIHSKGLVYGVDFLFSTYNEKECLDKEIYWISFYGRKTLCNLTDGGEGMSGYVATKETRDKHRANMIGNSYAKGHSNPCSAEARSKLRVSKKGNKGRLGIPHSEETKAKIRDKAKGLIMSEETRDKLRQSHLGKIPHNKGKSPSKETRARMSASQKLRPPASKATRDKISEANRGHKHNLGRRASAETRAKLSVIRKGKKKSEETKAKMRGRIVLP